MTTYFKKFKTTRRNFLKILPKNSIGAEIGVFKGQWTKCILGVVKPKELQLIDGWWEVYGEYFSWASNSTNTGFLKTRDAYNEAKGVVGKYDKRSVCAFYIEDDLAYLSKVDNRYFDWVYLDSSHAYEQTVKELEILKDKVKYKGIIAGHDWFSNPEHRHHGVYKAVNEFCKKYGWKVVKLDKFSQWAIKKVK